MLAFLLLSGAAGAVSLAVIAREGRAFVTDDEPLLHANASALQILTDAQSAVHGFVATGDEAFLHRMTLAPQRFDDAMAELESRATAAGHRDLLPAFRRQEALGQAWLADFPVPTVAQARDDLPSAQAALRTGHPQRHFEEFRQANAATHAALEERLGVGQRRLNTLADITTLALSGLVVGGLLVGGVVASRTTRAVTGPLGALHRTLESLTAGDAGARTHVSGPAEVADVVAAANTLAEENERLHEARRSRSERERALRRITAGLHADLEVSAVLGRVVRQLGELLEADRVIVYGLGTEVDSGGIIAQWTDEGIAPISDGLPARNAPDLTALIEEAGRQGIAMTIDDVDADERLPGWAREFLRGQGVRATLFAQLHVSPGVSGGVAVSQTRSTRAWQDGDITLFEAIARVAELALRNAALYESQQDLVERLRGLDREKNDFVSSVSHELRTPLTSITGYLELLLDGDAGPLPSDQRGYVETIDRNARRLLALIEDLLILSRIESGTLTLSRGDVEIADVLRSVADELSSRFSANGVALFVDVSGSLGTVQGDAPQLERVLMNLLTNAMKFTPPGGEVTLAGDRVDDHAEFEIRDTGIGIPAEEHDRLFERFFRASTAQERSIPGTGLGLAIVRRIVEHHGGTVSIRSAPGTGTAVSVRLPVRAHTSLQETSP